MNTVRLTPEERKSMDRDALLISLPHTMVDFLNEDDNMDWGRIPGNTSRPLRKIQRTLHRGHRSMFG